MTLTQRFHAVPQGAMLRAVPGQLNLEIPIPGGSTTLTVHNVDPAICYSADAKEVRFAAMYCEKLFPLPVHPYYFTLPYEPMGRNSACAPVVYLDNGFGWTTAIYISGKRIPIMPAVIRSLVAHEYGHHIERYISWRCGSIEAKYAALRKVEILPNPRWHEDIGEIIANDIRILVFGVEPDYWPHDCAHPKECGAPLEDFWLQMKHNV